MTARRTLWLVMLVCCAATCPPPVLAARDQAGVASSELVFTGFVVDQAGILTGSETARLTLMLDRLQQRTGHQMAIVTVDGLGGRSIAQFTRQLANRWGVGRKDLNDGVVLLVAPNQRKVRIGVGSGLERILPDAFCASVLKQRVLPSFGRGAYGRGIEAGARALTARLSGDVRTR